MAKIKNIAVLGEGTAHMRWLLMNPIDSKHNKPFDPEIDRQNRQRLAQNTNRVCQDKIRGYQPYDPKAPVSRWQNTNRRERKLSQSGVAAEYGSFVSVPPPKLTCRNVFVQEVQRGKGINQGFRT